MMSEGTHQSVGWITIIYIVLMLLLILTVALNKIDLGPLSIVASMLIAMAKATLVVLYFMHVRFSSKVTMVFVAAAFLWLGILFVLVFNDYLTRDIEPRVYNMTNAKLVLPPPPGAEATRLTPRLELNHQPSKDQP